MKDILVGMPAQGLYQPVDYSEQFDLQWKLALDTSMRVDQVRKGCVAKELWAVSTFLVEFRVRNIHVFCYMTKQKVPGVIPMGLIDMNGTYCMKQGGKPSLFFFF